MPSLFYAAAFERRFPLPYLFFEEVQLQTEALGEREDDSALDRLIRDALSKCVQMDKVSPEDVEYVVRRLEALAKEIEEGQERDSKDKPSSKKQAFASSFSDWISKLDPHNVCLLLADYNYDRAAHLYCKVDRDDVSAMSEQWMHREWERVKVGYESVVYGFGGGYEDKPHAEIDVSVENHEDGRTISKSALDAVKF